MKMTFELDILEPRHAAALNTMLAALHPEMAFPGALSTRAIGSPPELGAGSRTLPDEYEAALAPSAAALSTMLAALHPDMAFPGALPTRAIGSPPELGAGFAILPDEYKAALLPSAADVFAEPNPRQAPVSEGLAADLAGPVDITGAYWDPALHATGADGKGVLTAKGVWRAKRTTAAPVQVVPPPLASVGAATPPPLAPAQVVPPPPPAMSESVTPASAPSQDPPASSQDLFLAFMKRGNTAITEGTLSQADFVSIAAFAQVASLGVFLSDPGALAVGMARLDELLA